MSSTNLFFNNNFELDLFNYPKLNKQYQMPAPETTNFDNKEELSSLLSFLNLPENSPDLNENNTYLNENTTYLNNNAAYLNESTTYLNDNITNYNTTNDNTTNDNLIENYKYVRIFPNVSGLITPLPMGHVRSFFKLSPYDFGIVVGKRFSRANFIGTSFPSSYISKINTEIGVLMIKSLNQITLNKLEVELFSILNVKENQVESPKDIPAKNNRFSSLSSPNTVVNWNGNNRYLKKNNEMKEIQIIANNSSPPKPYQSQLLIEDKVPVKWNNNISVTPYEENKNKNENKNKVPVKWNNNISVTTYEDRKNKNKNKVLVKWNNNISFNSPDELKTKLESFGTVINSSIPIDRQTNKFRNYGWVTFKSHEDAMNAIKLNNLDNMNIMLSIYY
jgi:hypothetical protein